MEPNNSVPESNETITSTTTVDEQQQQQQNSSQTISIAAAGRSYECNFCKRGFTNAQALGGHMNIHRKHKAKLKESSSSPPPNAASTTTNLFSNSLQGRNRPLPLLGERSSNSRNIHQETITKDPPSPVAEVDLELRLGHVQPPGNKITITRKFF